MATKSRETPAPDNVYETSTSLDQYLGLHYPSSGRAEGVPSILPHADAPSHGLGFPQRVARLLVHLVTTVAPTPAGAASGGNAVGGNDGPTLGRALDVGCAVGGSSFDLARVFERVDAFDYSASFIDAANRMKSMERVTFRVPVEGDICREVVAVHDEGVTPDVAARVNFFVGDACRMKEITVPAGGDDEEGVRVPPLLDSVRGYDGIIMSNLLCRVPDPMACLEALPLLVRPGSVVVILTPFTWLEEFTPRERWLGGYYEKTGTDGDAPQEAARFSRDRLQHEMTRLGFGKIHEEQMPLLIREHQRKYQYCISEATGWRKI